MKKIHSKCTVVAKLMLHLCVKGIFLIEIKNQSLNQLLPIINKFDNNVYSEPSGAPVASHRQQELNFATRH